MIFWIASYPKSGNTWLRALVSAYYYSENGTFEDSLLKKIGQFPTKEFFSHLKYNKKIPGDTCKLWLSAQEKINTNNKLNFFKTHNAFGKVNNYDFTNSQNSVGGVYIVRDPRNVITSIKNHYQLDDEKAIQWMNNANNYIYNVQDFERSGYGDFQYISSWNLNYKSWKVQKKIPMKFIRYEDLLNETYTVFFEVIEFINKITNNLQKIDKVKLKTAVRTTSFELLKNKEKEKGFSEAITSREDKNKKISFFHLGPKNDWRALLKHDLKIQLEKNFERELKELSYV